MLNLTTATMGQFEFMLEHSMTDSSVKSFRRGDRFDSPVDLKNEYHKLVTFFGEQQPAFVARLIGNDCLFGYAYMKAAGWYKRADGTWGCNVSEDRIYTPNAEGVFRNYDFYKKSAASLGIVEERGE